MLTKLKVLTKKWAKQEGGRFPKTKNFRALTMCKQCYTFYYKNSWHFEMPNEIDGDSETQVPVRFTQCPACIEQELALYDTESGAFA
ncbi:MAG: hypothetical protein V4690_00495 [Patescibacteria group bacterium]